MSWKKELQTHTSDYFLLFLGAAIFCGLYLWFWPVRVRQVEIGLGLGLFYTFWGGWHHWRQRSLTGKVCVEYAAYGFLMSIFLWLLAM